MEAREPRSSASDVRHSVAMCPLFPGVIGPAHCHLGTSVTLHPAEEANPNYRNFFSYPTSFICCKKMGWQVGFQTISPPDRISSAMPCPQSISHKCRLQTALKDIPNMMSTDKKTLIAIWSRKLGHARDGLTIVDKWDCSRGGTWSKQDLLQQRTR